MHQYFRLGKRNSIPSRDVFLISKCYDAGQSETTKTPRSALISWLSRVSSLESSPWWPNKPSFGLKNRKGKLLRRCVFPPFPFFRTSLPGRLKEVCVCVCDPKPWNHEEIMGWCCFWTNTIAHILFRFVEWCWIQAFIQQTDRFIHKQGNPSKCKASSCGWWCVLSLDESIRASTPQAHIGITAVHIANG